MSDFVKSIIAVRLRFEGIDEIDKFTRFFCDLYRIEIFKDGLDLILTKLQENDLHFEIRLIKGWDTNIGCYLTEQNKIFNTVLGRFSNQIRKKIILKSFAHNVLSHEMAHALEFESGLDLGEEFRKSIGFDMKNREAQLLPLRAEIKRLMVDALRSYPPHQFLSELFARYFELLAVTRDVHGTGDFSSIEVMDFFANTTNFVTRIFNPKIKSKINNNIAQKTMQIAAQVKLTEPQKKFQDNVDSFYKQRGQDGTKSWSKNVKSNAAWQAGFKKYEELEDNKK